MDKHHLLHYGREWTANKPSRALRNTPELIFPMYKEPHIALHAHLLGGVPTLGYMLAEHVEHAFEPVSGDRFRSVDSLLFALDSVTKHFKGQHVAQRLLSLVSLAVELQRPYIMQGMVEE